jgi:5-hydroxyisourate hydrolase
VHRATFDTGAYFAASGQEGFFPEVTLAFTVDPARGHHHVPLLLSPYSYTTYRGS